MKKYKKEWALIFLFGIPLAFLYNYWLYFPDFTGRSFFEILLFFGKTTAYSPSWGFVFGVAAGLVSLRTDFMYQVVMTYISAYLLFLLAIISFAGIDLFAIVIGFFTILVTVGVGCGLGYFINHFISKRFLKTDEKEIEQRNYVDYRKI